MYKNINSKITWCGCATMTKILSFIGIIKGLHIFLSVHTDKAPSGWVFLYIIYNNAIRNSPIYNTTLYYVTQKQLPQVFHKKGCFAGWGLQERDSGKGVPVNFAKFLKTPFLQNTSEWLLLNTALKIHDINLPLSLLTFNKYGFLGCDLYILRCFHPYISASQGLF